ncbi:MAG: hypothetical protein M1820_007823 [Bogoriella megaspora]|nr:MAG: hypothetical protein M1820_007823 [Bogoriella megaspora]
MSWTDWFWGPSDPNGNSKAKSQDPIRNLDPDLRKYLEQETAKPSPTSVQSTQQSPSYTEQVTPQIQRIPTPPQKKPAIPPEALYQDGRYAHLWKNYRPLSEIENAHKTPQDKLADIVDGYKTRKASLQRAALENCANEQIAISECFKKGGWHARSTMCSAETKVLDRCYLLQGKFMKALGYLALEERSTEEDERIQMHADTLYHRMLRQEAEAEEARKSGMELPAWQPVVPIRDEKEKEGQAFARAVKREMMCGDEAGKKPLRLEDLPPDKQKAIAEKARMDRMTPYEKALEMQAISQQIAVSEKYAKEIVPVLEEDARLRKERREQGKETFGDKMIRFWGTRSEDPVVRHDPAVGDREGFSRAAHEK